jgi:2-dehydropantoate 2-reductase
MLSDPAAASVADWVLVTTKTYDAEAAARWFPKLVGAGTRVAILQNGVDHVERFAPFVTREALLPVVVECPAERIAPGRIRQRGEGWMLVPAGDAGNAFADLFAGTPIAVRTTDDFRTAAWRKLCLNAPGAVSAITLKPAGVVRDPAVAGIMRAMIREVVAVGRAEGAVLEDAVVETVIEACRKAPADSVNSIHADRLAGRRMEVEARNGVIVRLGRRHGIATPFNEMAAAVLGAMQPA